MQKIGDITDTADGNGEFTDGNVAGNIQPTELMAAWFNSIQRELLAVLNAAGITPDKTNDKQLIAAINEILAKGIAGSGYLTSKKNLSDLSDAAIARGHLGLGEMATKNSLTVADIGAYPVAGGELKGEAWSYNVNNWRIICNNKGVFWRFDGNTYYLLLTKNGDPNGGWNDFRPLAVDYATGNISSNHSFHAVGNISTSNNLVANGGVYESGGGARVYSPNNPPPGTSGATVVGANAAYYRHGNGQIFMQAVNNVQPPNNAAITVYLPAAFPNGILAIGGSFYGNGGSNSDSWWTVQAVSANAFNLYSKNMTGNFSFVVTGY